MNAAFSAAAGFDVRRAAQPPALRAGLKATIINGFISPYKAELDANNTSDRIAGRELIV